MNHDTTEIKRTREDGEVLRVIYSFNAKGQQTGPYKSYYDNGKIAEEGFCKNGPFSGQYKSYYKSGALRVKCNYKNGYLKGEYKEYYETGELRIKAFYTGDFGQEEKIEFFLKDGNVDTITTKQHLLEKSLPFIPSDATVKEDNEGNKTYYFISKILETEEHTVFITKDQTRFIEEIEVITGHNKTKKSRREMLNGLKEGIQESYDDKGRLMSRVEYSADIKNGIYERYDILSGDIAEKGIYKNGKKEGIWEYNDFGLTYREISYKDGKYDGAYRSFDVQNGKKVLKERRYYTDGVRSGIAETYINGKIYCKTGYANGKKDGIFVSYAMDGTKTVVGEYLDGKKTGEWTHYLVGDLVLRVENYKDGKKHGLCKECYYHQTKQVGLEIDYVVETNYIDGLIDGEFPYEEFDKDGKITIKGHFINNKKEGIWDHYEDGELIFQDYYENGKLINTIKSNIPHISKKSRTLKDVGNFIKGKYLNLKKAEIKTKTFSDFIEEFEEIDGKKNGYYKEFDCNGRLLVHGYYVNDKKEGLWKRYHEDGTLFCDSIFINGIITGIAHEYFDNELSARMYISGEIEGNEIALYEDYWNGGIIEQGTGTVTNTFSPTIQNKEITNIFRNGKSIDKKI